VKSRKNIAKKRKNVLENIQDVGRNRQDIAKKVTFAERIITLRARTLYNAGQIGTLAGKYVNALRGMRRPPHGITAYTSKLRPGWQAICI
jgi:hypothetical protein